MDRLPALARQIDVGLDAAVRELAESAPAVRRLLPEGGNWVQRFVLNRGPGEPADLFEHVGHLFLLAILVPFFAFFLLRDMHRLIAAAMDRLPPQHVETSVAVWRELNGVIGRYIRGLVLDGLVVGALAALGLWAAGVPYPLLLGAFAGLANVVPVRGAAALDRGRRARGGADAGAGARRRRCAWRCCSWSSRCSTTRSSSP